MDHSQRRSVALSQNFLTNPALIRRILDTSSIASDDVVIEIGPGKGMLTRELARRCKHVLAIEKDPRLADRLDRRLRPIDNVIVFEADALQCPLPLTPYKVFANIPFNATAAIVSRLTETSTPPVESSLIMQKEAAERFIGAPRETLASLLIKPWFTLDITHHFRRDDFVPVPRVDIVLLRFSKRGPPLLTADERQIYRDFVTYGFTAWQPTVAAAFRDVLPRHPVEGMAIDLERRPSSVPFNDWLSLFQIFLAHATPRQRQMIEGTTERLRQQQQRLRKVHRTRSRD